MSSNPPQGYPVTRAQPDDNKNQQYNAALQAFLTVLARGVPRAVRTLTSLRVGSGSTLGATLDGTDGAVSADGAAAAFFFRDRANATKLAAWYRSGTVRLNTSDVGDLWLVDPSTGAATLAIAAGAWTVISAFTNSWVDCGVALGGATVRYRRDPLGNVWLQGAVKSGTAIAAAFTLPAGFRPVNTLPRVPCTDATTNTGVSAILDTSGVFTPISTSSNGIVFNAYFPTV